MSRIFDFKKRFGQEIDINDIREDFINKIHYLIIEPLDIEKGFYYSDYSNQPFDFIAIEFGYNPSDIIKKHNSSNFYRTETLRPSFAVFSNRDFNKTLLLVEIIFDYFKKSNEYNVEERLTSLENRIKTALNQPISLGVSWRDGKFYPEGVEEFDEKLISDVLKWLDKKPKIQALYKNALDHYSQSINNSIKRKDVIVNSFQAVEQITKEFLESPKESFDNNFNALVDKLELDKEWKKIFNSFKELSKEFGRHSGKKDEFIPNKEDTEAFLYLSGLILRLILQKTV